MVPTALWSHGVSCGARSWRPLVVSAGSASAGGSGTASHGISTPASGLVLLLQIITRDQRGNYV